MPSKEEVVLRSVEPFGSPPRMWWGRNGKEHGGEFYLGMMGWESESLVFHEDDRRKVAKFLRKFANRLDPPPRKEVKENP